MPMTGPDAPRAPRGKSDAHAHRAGAHEDSGPGTSSERSPHPDALHESEGDVKKDALSLSIATGVYGISFGALAIAAGLNTWQAMVLSLLLFSGGSQFAVVGVLASGGTGASAVATSTLLGVRNAIYGLQINAILRPGGWRKLLAAHVTIDESAAMSVGRPTKRLAGVGFWWTGLGVYILWNAMTFVGTLAGNAMGDPKKYGLDAAAVGAFLALLWPRLGTIQGQLTAAFAVVIALGLSPVSAAGIPVLATVVAAVAVGVWLYQRDKRNGDLAPVPAVEDPDLADAHNADEHVGTTFTKNTGAATDTAHDAPMDTRTRHDGHRQPEGGSR